MGKAKMNSVKRKMQTFSDWFEMSVCGKSGNWGAATFGEQNIFKLSVV